MHGGLFPPVPLTMIAQIVLSSSEPTHWIAIMMGPEPGLTVAQESSADEHADDGGPANRKDGEE
ncbi:MAG: hypothetical protein IIB68_01635 [Proteobacteria bacterium]|nr:hypothetical protein [Pseudomonadota bacterium]MCH7894769.1 hypothetical protein [Pseudomonadota bacterium]